MQIYSIYPNTIGDFILKDSSKKPVFLKRRGFLMKFDLFILINNFLDDSLTASQPNFNQYGLVI
jgi:hypothetical protein